MEHTREQMNLYKEFIKILTSKTYYAALIKFLEEENLSDEDTLELLENQWKALVDWR